MLRSKKVTPSSLLRMGPRGDCFIVWEQKNIVNLIVLHTVPALYCWATNEILVHLWRPQLSHLKNEGVGPGDP